VEQTRSRKLGVVIVGAGAMGRWHARAIASAGGSLVAVVDPDLERARTLAGRSLTLASLDAAELDAAIDVIHVCSPLHTHAELVSRALELGAHVVVEKPVATDAPSTARLLAAAAERDLMLVPVHQFVFQPGVQRLLAKRQALGTLVRCVFETSTAGAEKTGHDPDELVTEILPHPLSLFARFAPVRLEELEWVVARPERGELRAIAHTGGTSFEIAISSRARPTSARFELVGTRASAHADLFHGFAVVERGTATRFRKATRPFTLAGATFVRAGGNLTVRAIQGEIAYPGLRELVRRTYDAIRSGAPQPIEAEETLSVALARDRIIRF